MSIQTAAVVGGGVAGLTVAALLAQRGVSVRLFEQAAAITEVGAGIQISPNGTAVLRAMGLGAELAQCAVTGRAVELRRARDGRLVTHLALDPYDCAGQGSFYFFHRADLVAMLAQHARDSGVQIITDRRAVAVSPGAPAMITFDNGTTFAADLTIGADGVKSIVRGALGAAAPATFTGQVAWRAVIPAEGGAAPVAQVFMGPGRHLVSYPLRAGQSRNIVAVEERREWVAEGWHHSDSPDTVRAAFAGFGGPVPGWLAQVSDVYLWGLFRHPVASQWWGAGGAILGDAAHPTLPFMAQGANMALEDAWVLARAVTHGVDLDAALQSYQAARRARVVSIVDAATTNARLYHLQGAAAVAAHTALRVGGMIAPDAALKRYRWIYNYDVTQPDA